MFVEFIAIFMLDEKKVRKIADLARLGLSDDEVVKFQGQLSGILDWVDMLKEVDIENVDPLYQVTGLSSVLREDEVERFGDPDALLENSPLEVKACQVKVKRIIQK